MREIDFIPDWYAMDRIRKRRNVRHGSLIVTLFAVMMVWSFIVGKHVRHVSAEAEDLRIAFEKSKESIDRVQVLNEEIALLNQKSSLLDSITPRTKVTSIIGEISHLIQDSVILSKLSFRYDPIESPIRDHRSTPMAVVQVKGNTKNQDKAVSTTPSRLKVVFSGVASQQAAAASLIARLEDSPYFDQVALVYSKPKEIQTQDVTEFEISCIVADYRIVK